MDLRQIVADMIFEREALKFGAFRLKLHEKFPDAPLSPFYLNLRSADNPKPGPLTMEDYDLIADCLIDVVIDEGLPFEAIAGIPRAGDPIAEAINRKRPGDFRLIKLDKEEAGGQRRIIPKVGFNYQEGEIVLLFDDLVTKADTKVEAIQAIEKGGSMVRDLVVLVDREQGGKEQLRQAGYDLYSAFTMSWLLNYYAESGKITGQKHDECLAYMASV